MVGRALPLVAIGLLGCSNTGDNHPAPDAPRVPAGTVAIPLVSLDQLSYAGPLHTGGQAQAVVLDTGSTTLAVAAAGCTSCGVTPLYAPGSSAIDEHQTGSSSFGAGTGWSGEIYQDAVELGSDADVEVKLVAITSSDDFFTPDEDGVIGYQGILGLGPDANLIAGTTSYLTAAFAAGVPAQFAFQLCPSDGTMWIGGVDASAEAAPPAVTAMLAPTTDQLNAYLVTVDRMAVGSDGNVGSAADYGPVIIDTGSSISFLPTSPLAAITSAIEMSAGYIASFGSQQLNGSADMGCVTTAMTGAQIDAALPPLHVAFPDATGSDSTDVDLPATKSYLVFSGSSGSGSDNAWCYGFADSAELGGGPTLSLFGDSLLAAYVAVFDVADQQMGFAPTSGCGEADAVARAVPRTPLRVAGVPWWKQDPRVRVPRWR